MTVSHLMEFRPILAATGLFFGGLIVGSSGGGSREGSAHAATLSSSEPPAESVARSKRGSVSPALRKLVDRSEPLAWTNNGGRCALKSRAKASDPSRRGRPGSRSDDPDDPFHGLKMPALPIARTPEVLHWFDYFTENYEGRKNFTGAVKRSGRFQELIAKTLRERGLPPDLAAVALVESGFSPDALSSAGAAGIWQFMPATARAYGLIIESTIDERASIWQSTEAAAHHLADLYERFRSWELALAAYNLGYDGLERRLDEADTEDFWALADEPDVLPKETASYVPKVLAAAVILANLDELGFADVERDAAIDAAELDVPAGIKLQLIARAAGTSVHTLRDLNPELLSDIVPERGTAASVHVPRAGLSRARVMLPRLREDTGDRSLEVSDDFDWGKDDVRTGRSHLERTAHESPPHRSRLSRRRVRRHHEDAKPHDETKAKVERSSEPIDPPKREAKAEEPEQDTSPSLVPADEPAQRTPERPSPAPERPAMARVFYRVVPGDSVKQIAATVGLTVDQVLAQAHVDNPDEIKVGSLLELQVPSSGVSDSRRPLR